VRKASADAHQHSERAGKADCPEWSELPQACQLFLRGVTARAAAPVALVVGTLLSFANQAAVVFSGAATASTWVQVTFNYIVPFMVSSVGFLAARRVSSTRRDRDGSR
jgi:hypothetical protein